MESGTKRGLFFTTDWLEDLESEQARASGGLRFSYQQFK